jgi:hypothetical protein
MSIYFADSHVPPPSSHQINPRLSLLPAEFNRSISPITLHDLPGSQIPAVNSLMDLIFAPLKGEPMEIELLGMAQTCLSPDQDILDQAIVVGPGPVDGFDASLLDDNTHREIKGVKEEVASVPKIRFSMSMGQVDAAVDKEKKIKSRKKKRTEDEDVHVDVE